MHRGSGSLWIGLLVLVGLIVAACSGAPAPAPKSAAAPTTAPAAPAAPAATAAPAAAPSAASPAAAPAASPAAAAPAASPAAAAPAASGKPPVEVGMAIISNVNYTPVMVGIEKGLFLKHGIDLKIKVLSTAPETIKAVQAGDVQLSVGAWSTIAPAREQGIDLKMWSLIVNDPSTVFWDQSQAILVRPGLNVNSVAELKGLKIGASLGSATDTYARTQIAKAGLKPDDVQFLQVPAPNQAAAIATGNIDAVAISEPYGVLIERTVPGSKVLVRDGGVYNLRVSGMALSSWIDKNPDLAEAVWAGMAESQQFVRQNPDAAAEVVSRQLTLDVKIAREALGYIAFDPRYNSNVEKAFLADTKILIEQKKMTTEVPAKQVAAVDFMLAMQKKYPQYTSDLKPVPE